MTATPLERRAYYATGRSGLRAWWTLLHPPYTLMHLSFVVVGAALAPALDLVRLGLTVVAFLLAMGVAAHALDERQGRPLNTQIPGPALVWAALMGLGGAVAIGIWGAFHWSLWPGLGLVALGAFLVVAYNQESWGGRFHNGVTFAAAWGAFPVLVAYYAQSGRIDLVAVLGAAYAYAASHTQRILSTAARRLRREVVAVDGHATLRDGQQETLDRAALLATPEAALRTLVATCILVASALLAASLAAT